MKLEEIIDIAAPPETVWAVTVDVERWPEWSPTMQSVARVDDGPFGRDSRALIKQPGLPETEWVVTSMVPGEAFTWETRVRGMHLVATHELSATASGTRNLLRVEMCGLVARLLWPLARGSVADSLRQENAGLKRRSEELSSTRGDD